MYYVLRAQDYNVHLTNLLTVVEVHAEGEPGRVITGGVLDVPGETMFEKKLYIEQHREDIRRTVLLEPRGHMAVDATLILPSKNPAADAGFVIMLPTEYPPMSGSNTMCVATVLLETGILPMTEPVTELTLEAPAGLVKARVQCEGGRVRRIAVENVPAYTIGLDMPVDVPGLGSLKVDVAFGGGFFAILRASDVGLRVAPECAGELASVGERIKAAAAEQIPCVHPENPGMHTIRYVMFTDEPSGPHAHGRNAVALTPGRVDRSPCGTGTSARLAAMHSRGELGVGEEFVHESTIGTLFTGKILRTANVGPYEAVVPEISGRAWLTGIHTYGIDPEDPLRDGFALGDTWGGMLVTP